MGLLRVPRRKRYDRVRSLRRASDARTRGRTRKAIAHYREVLTHSPHDADVHRRIAPLLAASRRREEAWQSYRMAVYDLVRAGFLERAAGVLREAAGALPEVRQVWEEIARVELARARPADAHRSLLEGRRRFTSAARRGDAVQLLLAARRIRPDHFEANYDLARLLGRCGAREPALRILETLAERASGRQLRRARAGLLRLEPSPRRLWAWLGARLGRRERPDPAPARKALSHP